MAGAFNLKGEDLRSFCTVGRGTCYVRHNYLHEYCQLWVKEDRRRNNIFVEGRSVTKEGDLFVPIGEDIPSITRTTIITITDNLANAAVAMDPAG